MNIEIKKGDYIEGIEAVGTIDAPIKRKMRIIVDTITTDSNGNTYYYGRADDTYFGARGGSVSTEHGEVKIITDEEPFTRKWWWNKPDVETDKSFDRVFCAGELVQHFKGMRYMIIDIGEHVDTGKKMVMYKALYGDYKVWIRDYDEFVSRVDKRKYPKATQKYRFEKVYK